MSIEKKIHLYQRLYSIGSWFLFMNFQPHPLLCFLPPCNKFSWWCYLKKSVWIHTEGRHRANSQREWRKQTVLFHKSGVKCWGGRIMRLPKKLAILGITKNHDNPPFYWYFMMPSIDREIFSDAGWKLLCCCLFWSSPYLFTQKKSLTFYSNVF